MVGFIVVIPPASGISCYVKDCAYYPDDEPYCRDNGLVDCLEADDDKCGTLSFTLGSNIRVKVWNCTRSTHDDCNEQVTCGHMRELAVDIEDTIESCAVTCCDGDGCNDPGKMEELIIFQFILMFYTYYLIFFSTTRMFAKRNKKRALDESCYGSAAISFSGLGLAAFTIFFS